MGDFEVYLQGYITPLYTLAVMTQKTADKSHKKSLAKIQFMKYNQIVVSLSVQCKTSNEIISLAVKKSITWLIIFFYGLFSFVKNVNVQHR